MGLLAHSHTEKEYKLKRLIIAMLAVILFAGTAYGADCAITVTKTHTDYYSGSVVAHGYITISAGEYPIEGMALVPGDFGMSTQIDNITFTRRSGMYDVLYNSTSTLLFLTQPPGNATVVTEDPVTTDSDRFIVSDEDNPQSLDKRLVVISPSGGGPNSFFCSLDAQKCVTRATMAESRFFAADGVTGVMMYDTVQTHVGVFGGPTYADTLFFDDDGADKESRLYYSGTGLGDVGDLYVPYSNGRMIKVSKSTNSALIALGANPVYFDADTTASIKLYSTTDGDADSDFGADIAYTSIAGFAGKNEILPDDTAVATEITYWFTAFGK